MQQIERYGVIALVFLLVTIVAISFWGDSKSPGFWSKVTGRDKKAEIAKSDVPAPLAPQVTDPTLPLGATTAPIAAPTMLADGTQPTVPSATTGTPIAPPAATLELGTTLPPADPFVDLRQPAVLTQVTPPARPTTGGNSYTVQKGDSPARIATRMLGSEKRLGELLALNPGLDPRNLQVGQTIQLPAGAAATTQPAPIVAKAAKPKSEPKKSAPIAAKSSGTAGSRTYFVKKGDGFHSIARRELGDERRWKDIAALNPSIDPKKLAIGMRLKLPGEAQTAVLVAAVPTSSAKPRVR